MEVMEVTQLLPGRPRAGWVASVAAAIVGALCVAQLLSSAGTNLLAGPSIKTRKISCVADSSGRPADLVVGCAQRSAPVTIACVGDSITAGHGSSAGDTTYPARLQQALDLQHPGQFLVTNLGHRGIAAALINGTGNKRAEAYSSTVQYQALMAGEWDIAVVMLGTNDAKQGGGRIDTTGHFTGRCTGGPDDECEYVKAMRSLLTDIKTRGRRSTGAAPAVYVMVPPPLLKDGLFMMSKPVRRLPL